MLRAAGGSKTQQLTRVLNPTAVHAKAFHHIACSCLLYASLTAQDHPLQLTAVGLQGQPITKNLRMELCSKDLPVCKVRYLELNTVSSNAEIHQVPLPAATCKSAHDHACGIRHSCTPASQGPIYLPLYRALCIPHVLRTCYFTLHLLSCCQSCLPLPSKFSEAAFVIVIVVIRNLQITQGINLCC